jgi:hypothetical protein
MSQRGTDVLRQPSCNQQLTKSDFGFLRAIHRAGVKAMSLRNKIVVFTLGAIAAVAGLSLALTSLKHASIFVASAVWGS